MNDTFAHAIWGIDLDEHAAHIESAGLRRLNGLLREASAKQDIDPDICDEEQDELLSQILTCIGMHGDNTIGFAIVPEEIADGCESESGQLYLGYGLRCFPLKVTKRYAPYVQMNIDKLEQRKAKWHTWVT